jgi:hypothetical protein
MIVFGAFCTFDGFRKTPGFAKGAKIFRICGPVLVVSGTILLFAHPPPTWTRQTTDDTFASAEFPGIPTLKKSVESVGGLSLPLVSYTYNVPGQDITLFLSRSPVVDPNLTDDQRIDLVVADLSKKGFEVAERQRVQCGDVHGYFFRLRLRDKNGTVIVRFAIAHTNVYRAFASFTSASEMQQEISRFVESFQVRD